MNLASVRDSEYVSFSNTCQRYMLNAAQIGVHHFHRLAGTGSSLGYVQLHPQGSSYQQCPTADPSRPHVSWTLSSRSSLPSLDRASSQTSISSDAIKEAKQDLHEVIYEAIEELEHVLPPSRPSPPYRFAKNTHARNLMNESANDCLSVVKQRVPQLGGALN
jgi:hypothetical protein